MGILKENRSYDILNGWLEATSDQKISEQDVLDLAKDEGYEIKNVQIFFDNLQGFWRVRADIKQLKEK